MNKHVTHTLSILIPSLTNRKKMLDELLKSLEPQLVEGVEICINIDNGKKSTGQKRNELIKGCNGEYIAFIDDDDKVSGDYIALVLEAVKTGIDVVGMHLLMTRKEIQSTEERTYHSLKYKHWYDEPDPDRKDKRKYFRNPNHLNPVKREFALQVGFPDKDHGEDHDYSKKLLPLLKTEFYIESPIYYYLAERIGT